MKTLRVTAVAALFYGLACFFPSSSNAGDILSTAPSKKVGPIVITIKKVAVLTSGPSVFMSISNETGEEMFFNPNGNITIKLSDDNGNEYSGRNVQTNITLTAKSATDINLNFENGGGVNKNKLGNSFDFSMIYGLAKEDGKNPKKYEISFSDLTAQKSR